MWILKYNGEIVSITTLRTLTDSELASETEKKNRDIFTKAVNKKLGTTLHDIGIKSDLGDFFDKSDMHNFTPYVDNEGIEDTTMPEANRYIEYEVPLPRNINETSSAKVVSWVKDKN